MSAIHAPSFHSSEYRGSGLAAHSPHPLTSPASARTRMARLSRSSPKLVRNGRTSGSTTSRSSNPLSGMLTPAAL